MRPIVIPPRSPLLRNVDMANGAGWAMHRAPPGFVRQENEAALGEASAATRGQAQLLDADDAADAAIILDADDAWTTGQGICSLLDADDAAIIPKYDAKTAGNAAMRHTLEGVFPQREDIEADISFDERVPWWLWLTTRSINSKFGAGIVSVSAGRLGGYLFVKVILAGDEASHTATWWGRNPKPTWRTTS